VDGHKDRLLAILEDTDQINKCQRNWNGFGKRVISLESKKIRRNPVYCIKH
jgi:hypothetical protein